MAAIWLIADCYYFWGSLWFRRVVGLNLAVAIANMGLDFLPYSYAVAHSVWHLVSVTKVLYVAYLLSRVGRQLALLS